MGLTNVSRRKLTLTGCISSGGHIRTMFLIVRFFDFGSLFSRSCPFITHRRIAHRVKPHPGVQSGCANETCTSGSALRAGKLFDRAFNHFLKFYEALSTAKVEKDELRHLPAQVHRFRLLLSAA